MTLNYRKFVSPLRISFGGGGSEIDPYRTLVGGKVVNCTINLYSKVMIVDNKESNYIELISRDYNSYFKTSIKENLDSYENVPEGCLISYSVMKFFSENYNCLFSSGLQVITSSDSKVGSGLGTSSSLTVTLVKAFFEIFSIPHSKILLADTAFEIERKLLKLQGGLQDHYCASFGGLNYMEFGPGLSSKVEGIPISEEEKLLLENSLLLIETGLSRNSSLIIKNIIDDSISDKNDLMNYLVENANQFKQLFYEKRLDDIGKLLNEGWQIKKKMSNLVSNEYIENIFSDLFNLGIFGGKICGAGGGGYLLINFDSKIKDKILDYCAKTSLKFKNLTLTQHGAQEIKLK